ncbi:OmpA family protein [Pedobacter sp. HDW13]|uniref:OmpA family protein n=1 Tax=Pedobacter sp. HDW13 TaxID=2714940 RepID=UPI00140E468F|nr:OmpA family protein [Pedobacter sp. HDW13]QIL40017.1 OmpA family protein [Pedobacter sp. HDW13]
MAHLSIPNFIAVNYKRFLATAMLTLLLLFGAKPGQAQYVLNAADAQYELFNYSKAINLYEQAYQKKPTQYTAERLYHCYAFINDYKQAESWSAIAAAMPDAKPENILAYAKALQQNSKYTEAKQQFQKYAATGETVAPADINRWLLSCDSALYWMKNPTSVIITNAAKLNSAQSDWGLNTFGNGVTFASDRGADGSVQNGSNRPFFKFDGTKKPDKNIYGWTGNHYLRLYTQRELTDSVSPFPIQTHTDYHMGPASFTQSGKEMYFTLTKIPKHPVYVKGKLATVNVEIYSAKLDEKGNWGSPLAFSYNKVDEYSVSDPFISADGNTLYFSSTMPGGLGGADIYFCLKRADGTWQLPVNLKALNTAGNERTPVLGGHQDFYFSSDGRVGMGGLDIYKANLVGDKISKIENMGYPLNSPQDDFAFLKTNALNGYLSSNRTGGLGNDDIYSFTAPQLLVFKLTGIVFDKRTNLPLNNALITLNKTNIQNLKVLTGDDGTFQFNLEKSADYELTGEKTAYRNDLAQVTTKGLTTSTMLKQNLYLEKIELEKAIKLENIYYDFDKSDIRPDAAIELNKLVKIMKDNPTIWIELGSHTDSRGNDQYNMQLSQNRANAAVQYIINQGIAPNRITAKGYGESQLLNKCANGVKCTAAEHQLNRRTEFKIVKL